MSKGSERRPRQINENDWSAHWALTFTDQTPSGTRITLPDSPQIDEAPMPNGLTTPAGPEGLERNLSGLEVGLTSERYVQGEMWST